MSGLGEDRALAIQSLVRDWVPQVTFNNHRLEIAEKIASQFPDWPDMMLAASIIPDESISLDANETTYLY